MDTTNNKKLTYNTKKIDYYGNIQITTILNPPLSYFTPTENPPDFVRKLYQKIKKEY